MYLDEFSIKLLNYLKLLISNFFTVKEFLVPTFFFVLINIFIELLLKFFYVLSLLLMHITKYLLLATPYLLDYPLFLHLFRPLCHLNYPQVFRINFFHNFIYIKGHLQANIINMYQLLRLSLSDSYCLNYHFVDFQIFYLKYVELMIIYMSFFLHIIIEVGYNHFFFLFLIFFFID